MMSPLLTSRRRPLTESDTTGICSASRHLWIPGSLTDIELYVAFQYSPVDGVVGHDGTRKLTRNRSIFNGVYVVSACVPRLGFYTHSSERRLTFSECHSISECQRKFRKSLESPFKK
jgi:hypothetical protein